MTFDEGEATNPANSLRKDILLAATGPLVSPGVYASKRNHYSLLRTLEDGFNLFYLGAAATAAPIDHIWR